MDEEVKKYFAGQEPLQKQVLEKIRRVIMESAPQATESMSYGVPAFKLNGNLIVYAAFTKHIGLYLEPDAILHFADELKGFETAKGTIKFKLDEPIPYELIEKIVRYRVEKKQHNKSK